MNSTKLTQQEIEYLLTLVPKHATAEQKSNLIRLFNNGRQYGNLSETAVMVYTLNQINIVENKEFMDNLNELIRRVLRDFKNSSFIKNCTPDVRKIKIIQFGVEAIRCVVEGSHIEKYNIDQWFMKEWEEYNANSSFFE
jgi:hypothetical protein